MVNEYSLHFSGEDEITVRRGQSLKFFTNHPSSPIENILPTSFLPHNAALK
jgi:hypothetical protein